MHKYTCTNMCMYGHEQICILLCKTALLRFHRMSYKLKKSFAKSFGSHILENVFLVRVICIRALYVGLICYIIRAKY